MSASPRKLIKRALDALEQARDVMDRYPEARAELEKSVGQAGVVELDAVRDALAALVDQIEHRAKPTA